jgi:hypothetical protein
MAFNKSGLSVARKTTKSKSATTERENWHMKQTSILRALAVIGAMGIWATPQANADIIDFDLGAGNSAISGFSGPYAQVEVNLTSSTTATITFTSLTSGGNIYLMGDGGTVGVNVNAASWSVSGLSSSNGGTGFSASQIANAGAKNEDGFGSFNQTFDSFDGFTHSSDTVSFTLTDTSGTWSSASSVLTGAAAHIFVTSSPANASNGALVTGFAAVPEPTTVVAGLLLLLPLGASTIRVMRRGNRSA